MGTDGNEGRTPGRVAENWGRQDRIRAGAVSGPWRSAPKTDAASPAPPAAGPVIPPAAPATARPVSSPVAPASRASEAADRDTAAPPRDGERLPLPYRPRLVGVWIGVAVGVAVALATVGAAVVFRNSEMEQAPVASVVAPPPEAAAPDTTAGTPAPTVAGAQAPAPEAAPAEVQGVIRLRVGPNLPEAERDAVAAALEAAGYGPVQVEVLPFAIAASRVGYYRPEDAEAAEALAAFVRGVVQTPGITLSTRDYSRLLQDAEPGRLDIWIEG